MYEADTTVYLSTFCVLSLYLAQKPEIYRCIRYKRERFGFFAETQIIFGKVLEKKQPQQSAACFLSAHLFPVYIDDIQYVLQLTRAGHATM